MSDVLILQPPSRSDREDAVLWTRVRRGAVIADGRYQPGDVLNWDDDMAPERAIVLLPSEEVFIRRAPVPGQNERDARRAAPFLLEDHLAQPLDELDVQIGPVGADGARWICAVDIDTRDRWRRMLSGLSLTSVQVVPDAMVLQGHGGDLTVMRQGDRVLFQSRTGDVSNPSEASETPRDLEAALTDPVCGAVEPDLLAPVLTGLGHQMRPRRLLISPDLSPAPLAVDDAPLAVKRQDCPDLRLAAAALDPAVLADLPAVLGDVFAAAIDWKSVIKPWGLAAGLSVAAGLAVMVLSVVQALYLEGRADRYREASRAAFAQAFPETRVVNVNTQMRQALRQVQGGEAAGPGFLVLSGALADILADQDRVRVDAVRYDASRGELAVTALYTGFGDFEALRLAAQARGVVLEDGGARQGAQGVSAEFTVSLP